MFYIVCIRVHYIHLIRLALQVFEMLLRTRQALVVCHVPLHHLVVRMLQQECMCRRHGLRKVITLHKQMYTVLYEKTYRQSFQKCNTKTLQEKL